MDIAKICEFCFRDDMTTKTRIRLGRPSDIKAVNDVVERHKMLKGELIQKLKELSEMAEGLVINQVENEIRSTAGKMAGRGIVIVSGLASIFLLPATDNRSGSCSRHRRDRCWLCRPRWLQSL